MDTVGLVDYGQKNQISAQLGLEPDRIQVIISKSVFKWLNKKKGKTMVNSEKRYETDYRLVTIKTSDGSTVQGKVNISPNQRVSELFNLHKGPFVVMVEATFGDVHGKTLFVNKEHIVWVEPQTDPKE